jgi:hypothetical protein
MVENARDACEAAAEKHIEELIQPAFQNFMEDKIDAAELESCKREARESAEEKRAPLLALDGFGPVVCELLPAAKG